MLAALLNELRTKIDGAFKLAVAGSIVVVAGVLAFISFTVVLFLWTQQSHGTLEAWAAIGVLFLLIAAVGLAALLTYRRNRRRAGGPPRPARQNLLQDPAVAVAALQLARTLSARGLLPLLIIGAFAGGILMNLNRNGHAGKAQGARVERGPNARSL